MSIFDRLGNLGKGILHNTFSGESGDPEDAPASQQERLRRAFEQGRLTTEEYREKLSSLSARLTQLRTPSAEAADPEPLSTEPAAGSSGRAGGIGTTRPTDPAVADRRWEDQAPVKRTL